MSKLQNSPFCHNPNQTHDKTSGSWPPRPLGPAFLTVMTVAGRLAIPTFSAPPRERIYFPPHQHQAGSYDWLWPMKGEHRDKCRPQWKL